VAAWMTLGAGLRLPVGWGEMLVFVPFVSLAAMVPVTVAGIGVREGAWALLLAPYGVAAADAVAFSLLYFLAFCLVGAAGGVVFALQGMGRAPSAPGALAAARGARPAA
jgi:branched-subunit amino acid transport protein